jgi:hypothetical protein
MIKIQKVCPKNSPVTKYCADIDYYDCVSATVHATHTITPEKVIGIILFDDEPWMEVLFRIRNILVLPFGLETGPSPDKAEYEKNKVNLKPGDFISFFKIIEMNREEILLGASDKHLDAWFSVKVQSENTLYTISFSTWVKYSNFLGTAYFFFVKPFHVLIMKSKMRKVERIYKNLNK